MDGLHDMGGVQGFGRMPPHDDERPFHHDWEPSTYAIALWASEFGHWTFDAGRYAIERIPARDYLRMRYFERVLCGMCTLAVEKGLVTQQELRQRAGGAITLAAPMANVSQAPSSVQTFRPGEWVAVLRQPGGVHTRCPAYIQGRVGQVVASAPAARDPGEAGHLRPARLIPSYHVRFAATDLWPDADGNAYVVVDVFASYLQAAAPGPGKSRLDAKVWPPS
jgi:nitrile hydratase subunit beta